MAKDRSQVPAGLAKVESAGSPTRALAVVLLLVLSVLAIYARVGQYDFVAYDDPDYVYGNPNVAEGLTVSGLRWAFTSSHSANWHPVTWLSHMLDVELFGLGAGGHHWMSVGLHALNAVLLFVLLFQCTGALWRSGFAAALFAVHPLRVQSVAWISERKDLLSGVFCFLCLIAWVRHVRSPSTKNLILALCAFALGLMSKPMLVSLPLLLLLLDRWPLERWSRERAIGLILEKAPFAALALVSCIATVLAQHAGRTISSIEVIGPLDRIANAALGYGTYLSQSLWPHGLAYFHPHPLLVEPDWSPFGLEVWGWAGLLVALTWCLLHFARRFAFLAVGWFWFLVMLVPVIGIVQVGDQAWAERYAYLPLVGLHVMVAWGLHRLVATRSALRQPVAIGCVLLVAAYGVQAHRALPAWKDSQSLFSNAVAATARNYRAHEGLGILHFEAGDHDRAREEYEAGLAIRANDPGTLFNLGVLEERLGRSAEAAALFERAILNDVGWPLPYLNLAKVRIDLGDLEGAEKTLLELLSIEPEEATAHFNLGFIYEALEQNERAIASLAQAVRFNPGLSEARAALGIFLTLAGRRGEALVHLEEACKTPRPHPLAATKLAWILAAAPEEKLRNPTRAIQWGRYAIEATGEQDADALEAMAAALAAAARFDEAVPYQEAALRIISEEGRDACFARLRMYRSDRAYLLD